MAKVAELNERRRVAAERAERVQKTLNAGEPIDGPNHHCELDYPGAPGTVRRFDAEERGILVCVLNPEHKIVLAKYSDRLRALAQLLELGVLVGSARQVAQSETAALARD